MSVETQPQAEDRSADEQALVFASPGQELDSPEEEDAILRTWTDPPGIRGWIITVQNGPLANRYMFTAFVFFLLGGVEAVLMRTQLARPENTFLDAQRYNELFTVHGSTMMFLFAVPMMEAIANFLLPVMLGTRELPFPRMTAFGYWTYLWGGIFFYASFLLGAAPDGGWYAYLPLTGNLYSPGIRIDFWLLGLSVAEVAAIGAGIELTVAIMKFRAPGMTINRVPIYAWAILITGFMMLFGFTPLLVSTTLLELDRKHGTAFFNPELGGDPLLWQHLFWIFGHPDVYIMFVPAVGMISMIVPTFVKRPLVGYTFVVLALVMIGFMSFGLWVHHMFTTGLPLLGMAFFAAASFAIGLASGTQVFAWIATIWAGRPVFATPFLYALGFIVTFVIGGISGIMVATVPFDWQVHDTYFLIAHFHYVLVGGVVFPILGGLHYWLPGNTGRMLSERLGKWSFWLVFIGFNVTFFPMHITGLLGMPRRYYTYLPGLGWDDLNLLSTIGTYILTVGVIVYTWNIVLNIILGKGRPTPRNPWGAGTLDWATVLPPPDDGYRRIPVVTSQYPLWQQERLDRGDPEAERLVDALARAPTSWRATFVTSLVDARPQGIVRLATPSWWPITAGAFLTLVFVAELFDIYPLLFGGLAAVAGCTIVWLWPSKQEREIPEVDADGRIHGLPVYLSGSDSPGWWVVVLMLLVFAVALGCMVFGYFYLVTGSAAGAAAEAAKPDGVVPLLATGALLTSAITMRVADRGIRRGRQAHLNGGLAGSFVLGLGFVGLLFINMTGLGFTHSTNAYGSLVFLLLGFELLLAMAGLVMSAVVQLQAWLGYFNRLRFQAVENVALYWYFVVAAWVLVLLPVVYLSPYLR